MSLWHKSLDQIEFGDVKSFCQLKLPEGLRLDYKEDFPKDLRNLVAAFANTQGGLILLGVEADKTTNTPVLPIKGMAATPGIEERIVQICRDGIYPPVRPQISNVIDNPDNPGTVVVVVRIDESPHSPHAVSAHDPKHVYERTGNQNRPYDHADIRRIEHLLQRRRGLVENRESYIAAAIQRAERRLTHYSLRSFKLSSYWASVIPAYPSWDLCIPEQCKRLQREWAGFYPDVQRVPEGSISVEKASLRSCTYASLGTGLITSGVSGVSGVGLASLSSKGHVFAFRRHYCEGEKYFLSYVDIEIFAHAVFKFARQFYAHEDVEMPGLLMASIGLVGVLNACMDDPSGPQFARGRPYPDESFRADEYVYAHEFIEAPRDLDSPGRVEKPLLAALAYGFDVDPPKD